MVAVIHVRDAVQIHACLLVPHSTFNTSTVPLVAIAIVVQACSVTKRKHAMGNVQTRSNGAGSMRTSNQLGLARVRWGTACANFREHIRQLGLNRQQLRASNSKDTPCASHHSSALEWS